MALPACAEAQACNVISRWMGVGTVKIAIWRSGHEIADTVAIATCEGINKAYHADKSLSLACYQHANLFDNIAAKHFKQLIDEYDLHIAYGILRGTGDVFKECVRQGKTYVCLDKGYWKPGHYDGTYRVSLRGTQQTSGWPEPDYARWDALGLEIEPYKERSGYALVCPPTEHVEQFFGQHPWPVRIDGKNCVVRSKGMTRSLDVDLAGAARVITFNSSVAWEALRRGIQVMSDPLHSIIGAWMRAKNLDTTQKLMDSRRELFATMASLQMTLEEMRSGLFPLIQKLLAVQSMSS